MTDTVGTVRVELGQRSYDIRIGSGNLAEVGRFIAERLRLWHAVVITDENVEVPHARLVAESLATAGARCDLLVVPAGEPTKCIDVAAGLWQKVLELETDRKSVIVAAGGGVVGDLAGFIAATYARGVPLVQVPTSLLAQVDSSVGGKVGINLPDAKNMVGAFLQPAGVLIDTEVLKTLDEREYRAGLAEVVKHGAILDADYFEYLEQNIDGIKRREAEVLRHVITRSCQLKAGVVQQDEREESGLRAVLNYGHTLCHAIESVAGYGELLHGEAVSIGMIFASRLAERLGRIKPELTKRQYDLLSALGLPVELPELDRAELVGKMLHDKKTAEGRLRFVLPNRLGLVELVDDVKMDDVEATLGC